MFQVIDEADRLLAQSFQDWLVQVLAATRPPKPVEELAETVSTLSLTSSIPCHDAVAPAFHHVRAIEGSSYVPEKKQTSCQKLLFSATLTRDPGKIAALELREPKYFVVQGISKNTNNDMAPGVSDVVMEKFSMPATLSVSLALTCRSYADFLLH